MPKLSIITINLNNADGLRMTINSVSEQIFKDFEFIIIDGASKDKSCDIISDYSELITYWVSESDNGIYNAMNKGISKANGEYCLFLNSGDYFHDENVLNEVFNITFDEDFVIGKIILNGKEKNEIYEIPDTKNLTFRYFLNFSIPHQCAFIKRALFDVMGFYNEKNILTSDWEFFLLGIFRYGSTVRKIPVIITIYDWNGISSLSENTQLMRNERKGILQKHFAQFLSDYEYLEQVDSKNKELEYQLNHSFWIFITKIFRKIKKIKKK